MAATASSTILRTLLHASPGARLFVRVVGAWALAAGRAVSVDSLAVVALVRHDGGEPQPLRRWTVADVEAFLWADAMSWCRRHGVDPPADLAECLWVVFEHLQATSTFGEGSDHPLELKLPLVLIGGLGRDGRPRQKSA